MREDRNVLDLLTADYTFVNERLAKHYGVPYVYGSQFRRVTLDRGCPARAAGQGRLLMVTSHADRTAPVLRGKWILENVLGTPPPPPLANVPPLEASTEAAPRTLRERMEAHRASPACAGCHKVMDPLGFALENFDAVGAWRTREAGLPIDASGQLADGTKVDGVVALRKALVGAVRCVCADADREADDLRARPRAPALRHAGRAGHRPRSGERRIPVLGAHHGDRHEHAVPDAGGERDRW